MSLASGVLNACAPNNCGARELVAERANLDRMRVAEIPRALRRKG
jgi:hypothetical protein